MAVSSKVLIAIITVYDVESDETKEHHRYKIYEFPNGVILVPGETTNDWYFDSREEYNPGGSSDDFDWYFEETEETEDWSVECLNHSILGYESEFCVSASSKVKELIVA
jgi:hypothetical protein